MDYRRLGKSGLQVSELSFGSWITFGEGLDVESAKKCMVAAFDQGINFFDNAEAYADGASEMLMSAALEQFRRTDLVISTKIFWGGSGPNDRGLSWKHLMEGTQRSLRRLQLDYVDLLFCHRPDPDTPIEETVRCMDCIIRQGLAFYWGTSEWSAKQIEQAHTIARDLGCIPPTMEQPEYNLFHRERVEEEYQPLYDSYGMGLTTWSPLDMGILTGKYNDGIPEGSRLAKHDELASRLTSEKISMTRELQQVAQDLSCSLAQLSLAWCLMNPKVSTVITGATKLEQLQDNLGAVKVKDKLTSEVMQRIQTIVKKKAD